MTHNEAADLTPSQQRTLAANNANRRRGQNTKADALIAAGWKLYTPEGDLYTGEQRGNESRPRMT